MNSRQLQTSPEPDREQMLRSLLNDMHAVHTRRASRRKMIAVAVPVFLFLVTIGLWSRQNGQRSAPILAKGTSPKSADPDSIQDLAVHSIHKSPSFIVRVATTGSDLTQIQTVPTRHFTPVSDGELSADLRLLDVPLGVICRDQSVQLVPATANSTDTSATDALFPSA